MGFVLFSFFYAASAYARLAIGVGVQHFAGLGLNSSGVLTSSGVDDSAASTIGRSTRSTAWNTPNTYPQFSIESYFVFYSHLGRFQSNLVTIESVLENHEFELLTVLISVLVSTILKIQRNSKSIRTLGATEGEADECMGAITPRSSARARGNSQISVSMTAI